MRLAIMRMHCHAKNGKEPSTTFGSMRGGRGEGGGEGEGDIKRLREERKEGEREEG